MHDYYVYPSFEKTTKFLHEHGYDSVKGFSIEDIKVITVSNYSIPVKYQSFYEDKIIESSIEALVTISTDKYGNEDTYLFFSPKARFQSLLKMILALLKNKGENTWFKKTGVTH